MMYSPSSIAKRTRSRKTLDNGAESVGKKDSNRNVFTEERSGGSRVRVCGSSRSKLGFNARKRSSDASSISQCVVIDEDEEEGDRVSTTGKGVLDSLSGTRSVDDDCVGWRARSKLGFESDVRSSEGSVEGVVIGASSGSGAKLGLEVEESRDVDVSMEVEKEEEEEGAGLISQTGTQCYENSCISKRSRSKLGLENPNSMRTLSSDDDGRDDYDDDDDDVDDDDDEEYTASASDVGNDNVVVIDDDDDGDDDDDDDDETRGTDCSPSYVVVEESCSYNNGGISGGDANGIDVATGGEGQTVETPLKRIRFEGLEVLVPADDDSAGPEKIPNEVNISVARRTRSHRHCSIPKKKRGTVSRPLCLDVDESDASTSTYDDDDDDDDDADVDDDDNTDGGDEDNEGVGGIRGEVLGGKEAGNEQEEHLGKSTKRKRVRAPKDDSLFKLLVDSIWEKRQNLPKELNPFEAQDITPPKIQMPFPLKFSFEEEVADLEEKSEAEKELNDLWAEFNFALKSNDIGTMGSLEVEPDVENALENEADPSTCCRQGIHQFIVDEEIGIICRFCSFVKTEIKYILPSIMTRPSRKWGTEFSTVKGDGFSTLDGLDFQDNSDDTQGSRVLTKGTVWEIIPGIKKIMHKHQREGFEFMWKNLAGGIVLEEVTKSTNLNGVGGCVISHAPGTGKTLLTIVFLQTFLAVFPKSRPIIVAPRSMLLTWQEEFKKWKVDIPFHLLNSLEFSGKEDSIALMLKQNKRGSKNWVRLVKIYSWDKGNSILGISYPLFERLAGKNFAPDTEGAQICKILLERPGLLVLDEGHTPRNDQSLIWKALKKNKTERRIILTGTPFQNNLKELCNTLCLVRPNFAEKISHARGKWTSLTNSIGEPTDDCLEELRSMISPFVHVHKGDVLDYLPGLSNYLVVLHPTTEQKRILDAIPELPVETFFGLEYKVSLASIHPSLLLECKPELEDSKIDKILLKKLRHDPNEGVKMRFVMELVRLSEAMNEKVLVFSQYLEPLGFIKEHLNTVFNWKEGREVLQMDGKVSMRHRQSSIDYFNDPGSEAKVLLASTKACSEGINLIGASRVVLLDVVWNPSVERQAISRAFRIGQNKVVYTYHLITSGTREEEKYIRQLKKDHISKLVFSSCEQKTPLKVFEDKVLNEMDEHEKLKNMFKNIVKQPKESIFMDDFAPVFR